jgi:hypothetical protein
MLLSLSDQVRFWKENGEWKVDFSLIILYEEPLDK